MQNSVLNGRLTLNHFLYFTPLNLRSDRQSHLVGVFINRFMMVNFAVSFELIVTGYTLKNTQGQSLFVRQAAVLSPALY